MMSRKSALMAVAAAVVFVVVVAATGDVVSTSASTSEQLLLQNALALLQSVNVSTNDGHLLCAQTYAASHQFNLPVCDSDSYYYSTSTLDEYYSDATTLAIRSSNQRLLQEIVGSSDNIDVTIAAASPIRINSAAEEGFFIFYNVCGAIFCIGCVALIAGLYLGLLTLDALDLEIIQRVSIDEDEIMYATNLLPLVKQRHRLLVTLLILNTVTMETLPVFLNNVVPNWVAILLSTTLILIFGEIIPSAIFTGPNQLYLGHVLAPLTKFFMWLLTPFAVPLGALLDYLVHGYVIDPKHPPSEPAYNRNELSALVRIQHESRMAAANRNRQRDTIVKNNLEFKEKKKDDSWNAIKKEIMERVNERWEVSSERNHPNYHHHFQRSQYDSSVLEIDEEPPEPAVEQLNPPLHPTEVDLVTGALQMKTRLVMDEYTPLRKVYALPDTAILSLHTVAGIYAKGYSRIPVYVSNENDADDRTAILGFLMIRQLILIDWDDERELSTLPLQRPGCVSPRMNLVDALQLLRTGGTLMAFVCARPEIANKALENEQPIPVEAGFMGIITLEDVMESILQGRIQDEWDIKDRDRAIATLHRWAATKLQAFVRTKRSVKLAKQLRGSGSNTPTSSGNSYTTTHGGNYSISGSANYTMSPIKEELSMLNANNENIGNPNPPRKNKWYRTFIHTKKKVEEEDDDDVVSDLDEETGSLLNEQPPQQQPMQPCHPPSTVTTPLLQAVSTRQSYTLYS